MKKVLELEKGIEQDIDEIRGMLSRR